MSAAQGTPITLTATPHEGNRFVRWEVVSGGITLSSATASPATFTMPDNAVEVKAVIEAISITPAVITITTQPANAAFTAGSISGSLSVSASATQGAALSYQWYSNTTASTTGGTLIANATSAAFTVPATLAAGTYYYYCEVSAAGGAMSVCSSVAIITVHAQPPGGTPPGRAVYHNRGTLTLGNSPVYTGRIYINNTNGATLRVITSGSNRFNPSNKVYTLEFADCTVGMTAVEGGASFASNFVLHDPAGQYKLAVSGNNLVIQTR
jgi:hypothetical protein